MCFEFPAVKLLDFEERWDELTASENPFAVVIQAHLKTLRTRDRPVERKQWKLAILRGLYDRGWGRDRIRQMFRFIDGLMTLPTEFDIAFFSELETIEEEKSMPYVTSIERIGLRRGRKEGRKEGELLMARESVIDVLEVRFGDVPDAVRATIEALDRVPALRALHREAIVADSMEVFEAGLAEFGAGEK